MPFSIERAIHPRRIRFQFSLTSLFLLTALTSLAAWYWYQRPFAVETKTLDSSDPFADGPTGRQVAYYRRVWGDRLLRHGPWREYDSSGRLYHVGHFRNDQRDGEFINYHPTAVKESLDTFVRGLRHGPMRRWNARGDLTFEGFYERDKRHGRFDYRDDNGQPSIEAHFAHGMPTGKWKWYLSSHTGSKSYSDRSVPVTITGQWHDGTPDGCWEWRDARGELYLSLNFNLGKFAALKLDGLSPRLVEAVVWASGQSPTALRDAFDTGIGLKQRRLADIADEIHERTRIPFVIATPNLERAGLSLDLPILLEARDTPFLLAVQKHFATHGLACEYCYGVLSVDTLDSIAAWQDFTGVLNLTPPSGSRLEAEWNKATRLDAANMPLQDIVARLSDLHGITIRLSLPSRTSTASFDPNGNYLPVTPSTPIALHFKGVSLKNALAILLSNIDCQASLQGEVVVIEPHAPYGPRTWKPQPVSM